LTLSEYSERRLTLPDNRQYFSRHESEVEDDREKEVLAAQKYTWNPQTVLFSTTCHSLISKIDVTTLCRRLITNYLMLPHPTTRNRPSSCSGYNIRGRTPLTPCESGPVHLNEKGQHDTLRLRNTYSKTEPRIDTARYQLRWDTWQLNQCISLLFPSICK
jgi:hypothetical protein